ncbi:MAG: hypothetical protein ACT4N2_11005 [Hyphomicrobium sp.]
MSRRGIQRYNIAIRGLAAHCWTSRKPGFLLGFFGAQQIFFDVQFSIRIMQAAIVEPFSRERHRYCACNCAASLQDFCRTNPSRDFFSFMPPRPEADRNEHPFISGTRPVAREPTRIESNPSLHWTLVDIETSEKDGVGGREGREAADAVPKGGVVHIRKALPS